MRYAKSLVFMVFTCGNFFVGFRWRRSSASNRFGRRLFDVVIGAVLAGMLALDYPQRRSTSTLGTRVAIVNDHLLHKNYCAFERVARAGRDDSALA